MKKVTYNSRPAWSSAVEKNHPKGNVVRDTTLQTEIVYDDDRILAIWSEMGGWVLEKKPIFVRLVAHDHNDNCVAIAPTLNIVNANLDPFRDLLIQGSKEEWTVRIDYIK